MQERPRLSVYVITYNQEDVIHRSMGSLLKQKDYIYEICINDDCSKDKTFEILQEYQRQYPDIVKPVQNEHNLGIFANMEAVMARLTGDMAYQLSGDDVCPEGYFKAVFDFIENKHIDWRNELFCIYGDYKEIEPNGMSVVYKNSMAPKHNAVKLRIRKLIVNRSACYSKKVLDKFEVVSDGRSYNAEAVQDIQLPFFTEKNYYIPVVGNIYYAGIGVSSRMNKEDRRENIIEGYQRLKDFVTEHGQPLDKKDLAFFEYMIAYNAHDMRKALKYFIKSIDISLGFKGLNFDRIIYVLKKRFRL